MITKFCSELAAFQASSVVCGKKTDHIVIATLLAVAVLVAYLPSLSGDFFFDDGSNLIDYKNLGKLWLYLDIETWTANRAFTFFTFSINHTIAGLSPAFFRGTNILIHYLNSLLVFLLLRLLINEERQESVIPWVAAFIFALHPLQTQAVSYIVQRLASLSTFFYLGTATSYLAWRRYSGPELLKGKLLFLTAFFCALLGMRTKETAFTIPFMLCVMEFLFIPQTTKKKRLLCLLPFFTMLPIIPLFQLYPLAGTPGFPLSVDMGNNNISSYSNLSPYSYLLTQSFVIVSYLKLLLFPVGQMVEHHAPVKNTLDLQVVTCGFILLTPFSASLYLFYLHLRREQPLAIRLAAFGILWFFITLSVESSIFPIPDLMFEHRVYLAFPGFLCVLISTGLLFEKRIWRKTALVAMLLLLSLLFTLTFNRNKLWGDITLLLEDNSAKNPFSWRVMNNLGVQYELLSRQDQARELFEKSIRANPMIFLPHLNLGKNYLERGMFEEAENELRTAMALRESIVRSQDEFTLLSSFIILLMRIGNYPEAEEIARLITENHPDNQVGYNLFGAICTELGKTDRAVESFEKSLSLQPDYASTHLNYGIALMMSQTTFSKAQQHLLLAVRLAQTDNDEPVIKHAQEQLRRLREIDK